MPLPVIPFAFRMTLNWGGSVLGVRPHNVLHFGGSGSNNEDDLAAAFDANADGGLFTPIDETYSIESIDIIALDGVAAQKTYVLTTPISGSGTGQGIPASAAVLSMHTAQRGPRGRGRLFLGPTSEGETSNGVWGTTVTRANLVTAWMAFNAAMVADGFVNVVASYVHEDDHVVTNYGMRPQVGTLRRRQDQLL